MAGVLLFMMSNMMAMDIWIAVDGDDHNPGTREQPMATLLMAQRKVRELRRLKDPSVQDGISIILKGGQYFQHETLFFRPEDSGTGFSPTVIKAAEGEEPVISGGIPVYGWAEAKRKIPGLPAEAENNIWMADIPVYGGRSMEFRQMWVNGKKAVRARSLGDSLLDRILSVDKEREEMWIPLPGQKFSNIGQMEFVIHQWWAIAILRVKSLTKSGDKVCLTFHQPESRIEFEHPWPAPFIDAGDTLNGNSAFFFVNAIELLNQPGEWFSDPASGKVYYWPREGENMEEAEVIVPHLETLVKIDGTPDHPVKHIKFEGLRFQHTTWMRPSVAGHVPIQAGMSLLDAYKLKIPGTEDKAGLENQAWIERQPAAVEVINANHIDFFRCRFTNLAATGLDFISGSGYCSVVGSVFEDIGGTAVQAGFFGDSRTEIHLPYNPSDQREVCSHINISNNLVTNCTNEDWGCVGISVGYAHDINIAHNEVSHLNYSGICIGWGWTPTISCMKNNRIHANHIHHFAKNMYDVGGIYTLSAQPNSEISNNCIHDLEDAPYAHIPTHYQYIYLDEGSSYIRVINNQTEQDKFFSNTPGPGNVWENNGPHVSRTICEEAGLQPEYKDLLNTIN